MATEAQTTDTGAPARVAELRNTCPIDLRALEPVPVSTPADVKRAVARARSAQASWALTPLDERVRALKAAAKDLLRARHEVIELARDEIGKNEIEGLFNEALGPIDAVSGWAKVVKAGSRRDVKLNPIAFAGKKAHWELVPRGVIGVIAPWNFPAAGLYRSVLPALLTGNGLVLKPSERSPRTSAWLLSKIAARVPDGLVQVVQGAADVGGALLESGIDACVFTGSVAAGKKVRVRCAELGIPCSAEMGGKDSAIVLADCALDRTVAGLAQWTLNNAGQACGAVEVLYVEETIADAIVARLGSAFRRLRARAGRPGDADVPPLANAHQLALVEAHVKDALAKGAKLVAGGKRTGDGLFYEPTLLDGCTDAMDVVAEETFGPVLAVIRVRGADEAVRRTNASRYGLTASIWTSDLARAERLAARLDVGVVTVNNHSMTGAVAALPWSGVRDTGYGIANGEPSLLLFARPKAVLVDSAKDPEPFWLPFDADLMELGELLSDAQLGNILFAWKIPLLIRRRVAKVKAFFRQ